MLPISMISCRLAKKYTLEMRWCFYSKASGFRYDTTSLFHSTAICKKLSGDGLSSSGASSTSNVVPKLSWIYSRYVPVTFRPYLNLIRADKQTGTMLLLWPCWWSIALATPMGQLPSLVVLTKFSLGALLMRSGKSTFIRLLLCYLIFIWYKK